MVLTESTKRIALFEAEGYCPPTIAKTLKSEWIFVSRRGVAKFYQEYTELTRERNYTRMRTAVRSAVPECSDN